MQGRLHWLLALVLLVQGAVGTWLVPTVAVAETRPAAESSAMPPCHGARSEPLSAVSDAVPFLDICLDCSDCGCPAACHPASAPVPSTAVVSWRRAYSAFPALTAGASDGHHLLDPRPPIA